MEGNENAWREYVVSIDCPLCEAKAGAHCFVKPGMHLLGTDGQPEGFHGQRLLDALKLSGFEAKITLDPLYSSSMISDT